jgi:hypothetical protein
LLIKCEKKYVGGINTIFARPMHITKQCLMDFLASMICYRWGTSAAAGIPSFSVGWIPHSIGLAQETKYLRNLSLMLLSISY